MASGSWVLLFAAGVVVSLAASWVLVSRLERLGDRAGLPEAWLGLVAALAADAPEITSAVTALTHGQASVGAGVVIGSNVFNLAALLGLSAVVAGRIVFHRRVVLLAGIPGVWVAAVCVLTVTGVVPPAAGLALTAAVLVPGTAILGMRRTRMERLRLPARWASWLAGAVHEEQDELAGAIRPRPGTWRDGLTAAAALGTVVGASIAMEQAATVLGRRYGIADIVVGGLVLAVVTSLPNAVAAVYLARRGRGAAVLSIALNSNALNVLIGLLVPASLTRLGARSGQATLTAAWYAGLTVLALVFAYRGRGLARLPGTVIIAERRSARSGRSPARAELRAREARERGLREGNAGHPAAAARHIRAGLRQLNWAEDGTIPDALQVHEAHHALAARMLGILAESESTQGRTEYGLRLLDRAESLAAADDRGILLLQRGHLFMRTWRGDDALRVLDDAVAMLDGNPAETANLASALIDRGVVSFNVGQVRRARADLVWCRRIAAAEGHDLIAAKALHNLGCCDLLAGDIPAALQRFSATAETYRLSAPGNLPVLAMDKARALLAAGLSGDAASELDSAMLSFRRQRLDNDLAEAELARAEAALGTGDAAVARRWAAAAQRRFRRQGNDALAGLAELNRLRAQSLSSARPAPIAAQAVLLAERLRAGQRRSHGRVARGPGYGRGRTSG